MTTTFDQVDQLYALLTVPASGITAAISGKVYRNDRFSPGLEDIVINSLPVGEGGYLQGGYANVNIYVPDLTVKGLSVANEARLSTLTTLVLTVVESHYADEFDMHCEYQDVMAEPETGSHYATLRVRFRHYNL